MSKSETTGTLTPAEYLTERMMSKLPVLLVEGDTDSFFFEIIRDELLNGRLGKLLEADVARLRAIQIETAAIIGSPEGLVLGNREKVEAVCDQADSDLGMDKLVGFVDREFRGFLNTTPLEDLVRTQHRAGRIRWSRGHSIENEIFEYSLMHPGMRDIGISTRYNVSEALGLFRKHFDRSLRFACAFSLAGEAEQSLTWLPRTFSPEAIGYSEDDLIFDFAGWSKQVQRRQKIEASRVDAVAQAVKESLAKVDATEHEVIRWMCHGHVGEAFLWNTFLAAVLEVYDRNGVPPAGRKVVSASPKDRFLRYLNAWLERVREIGVEGTPLECFRDLGVSLTGCTPGG